MARILLVRDALKARIDAAWGDPADRDDPANDVVLAPWAFRIDADKMVGRKLVVFPAAYAGTPATRSEDQDDYTYTILVLERYTSPGDPPDEWIDERVGFCEAILESIGNPRLPRLLAVPNDPNSGLWPEVAAMPTVFDTEELTERKLFMSVLSITYREHSV